MAGTAPKKKKSAPDANNKRERLLRAAEALFATKGFSRTQISEVALKAGTGISTFYRYFDDKPALLSALIKQLFHDLRVRLAAMRHDLTHKEPLERLAIYRKTFELAFATMIEKPELTRIMLRSSYGADDELDRWVWAEMNGVVDDMVRDIKAAKKAGLIKIRQPRLLADAAMGMALQLAHRAVIEGRPTAKEAAEICTRIIYGGFIMHMPADVLEDRIDLLKGLAKKN